MGRSLVKRALKLLGSLLLLATAWVYGYWLSVGRPPALALILTNFSSRPLGGSWELLMRTSSFDSGYQAFVARKVGFVSRLIVGRYVAQVAYLGEDCVAFETSDLDGSHVYFVACDGLDPVELARTATQVSLTSKGLEGVGPGGGSRLLSPDVLIRSARSGTRQ